MSFFKKVFILTFFCILMTSGCSNEDDPSRVPSDFVFVMDVRAAENKLTENIHVNVRINARGKGRFVYYDSGAGINYDPNGIVVYDRSQVVRSGKFRLTDEKLEQLWDLLNDHGFFMLDGHYQTALGFSYAFMMVEANDTKYMVNNIGMEVPEIRALVEAIGEILPEEIKIEYGEGFRP
jgi:hypothetical protein